MIIRFAEKEDAENFALLIQKVENTTNFMLFGPNERPFDPEGKKRMIEAFIKQGNSAIFLAESEQQLKGFLIAKGGDAIRNQHTAYIVIGILKNGRGTGIGTKLFNALIKWAREQNLHRLELTVMHDNAAGLALYKKIGFEMEGTKRHSLMINGKYIDEYYMSLLL
jgi:RimJ/RimL family protein N-acetyltransferase